MKNFKIALAALVAIMVVSCEKNPGGDPENKTSGVAIGISLPGGGNSRAVGTPVADQALPELSIGHIFLYSSVTGIIDKHMVLYTGTAPTGFGGALTETFANVTNQDNPDLVVIAGVKAEVDKCLVVLNGYDAAGAGLVAGDKTGTSISGIKSLVLKAEAINDASATINKVAMVDDKVLSSHSAINTGGPNDDQTYTRTADMLVKALGTRIQLKEITSHDYTGSDGTTIAITDYKVAGVYINYVYNQRSLGAEPSGAIEVNNGSTEANYFGDASKYASGQPGYKLADNATAIAANATGKVAPASGWWGYNLIPYPAASTSGVPHLIVHLTDIAYTINGEAQEAITDKWLTVKSYVENGTAVPNFLGNHVYSLSDGLTFDFNDLTDNPETESVALSVNIEVMKWVNHNVTPGF